MKFTTILFVIFFIHNAIAYSTFVNWKTRMNKYAALLNCSYYLSTELPYRDYFKFDNDQEYKFYFLSENGIKFLLSTTNDFTYHSYQIVIGRETSLNVFSNGMYQHTPTSISFVSDIFGNSLKVMRTPQIIRTDQPNEIVIQKIRDDQIMITVNENTPITFKSKFSKQLSFISFSSNQEGTIQEFFYDCNDDRRESPVEVSSNEQIVEELVEINEEDTTDQTEATTEQSLDEEQTSYGELLLGNLNILEEAHRYNDDDY